MRAGDRLLTRVGFLSAAALGIWGVFHYVHGNPDFLSFLKTTGGSDLSSSAHAGSAADNGPVVVCQTKSGFRRVDPLGTDASYTVGTPGTGAGPDAEEGENVVVIEGGAVRVERANCKNQVCVHHDPVSKPGEQIVCLPHGLVVQVAAREEDVAKLQ